MGDSLRKTRTTRCEEDIGGIAGLCSAKLYGPGVPLDQLLRLVFCRFVRPNFSVVSH